VKERRNTSLCMFPLGVASTGSSTGSSNSTPLQSAVGVTAASPSVCVSLSVREGTNPLILFLPTVSKAQVGASCSTGEQRRRKEEEEEERKRRREEEWKRKRGEEKREREEEEQSSLCLMSINSDDFSRGACEWRWRYRL